MLTDFGIVKLMDETTALTKTGGILGTPYFMAPEQWATGKMDTRTDLYALGVMVYLMLTGQMPFTGETPPRIMYAHLNETPPPPHKLNPALPPAVEKVLLKMLAKLPDQRYQTAGQFCTELQIALNGRKAKDEKKESEPRNLPKIVWGGGIILLIVLIVGGLFLVSGGNTSTPSAIPIVQEAKIEIDGQAVSEDFQKVACGKSHRLEIKLLDVNRARIEPGLFVYNWRFEPDDSINEDSLNSGSYARIYQVPCDLNNQTAIIEVQQGDKTLYTKSVNFDIDR